MSDLAGRFREVRVTLDRESVAPAHVANNSRSWSARTAPDWIATAPGRLWRSATLY
jgi:hypothetical protein